MSQEKQVDDLFVYEHIWDSLVASCQFVYSEQTFYQRSRNNVPNSKKETIFGSEVIYLLLSSINILVIYNNV